MKRVFAKVVAVCLIVSIFICVNIMPTLAADTFYQTTKSNVPVWREPSSSSKEVRRITSTGTVVTVTSSSVNSAGNLWYKIGANEWVFSGNVTEHKHNFSYGRCTTFTCKLSYVLGIANVNNVLYEVIRNDTPLRYNPYDVDTIVERKPQGTILTVVTEAENAYKSIWYKTNNGLWVYSGNVKKHNHVASMCGQPQTRYEQNNVSQHTKIFYNGDNLCSCGQFMSRGTENKAQENHTFGLGDKCTLCGYQKSSPVTTSHNHVASMCGLSSTRYEQNDSSLHTKIVYNGDNLCSCGQFMSKGTETRTTENHSFGTDNKCTKCDYQKQNSSDNDHVHVAAMSGLPQTRYEQDNSSSHTKIVYNGDNLCSCGQFMSRGTENEAQENHIFDSNDECALCAYQKSSPTVTVHNHVASMCGLPTTRYEQNDSSLHTKIFYNGDNLCSCGQFMSKGTETRTTENHTFNKDVCTLCAYNSVKDKETKKKITYINNEHGNAHYNRNKAKEYAEKYAEYASTKTKDTPNYASTKHSVSGYIDRGDGNNCTNFVSQCLKAGGMAYVTGDRTKDTSWFYETKATLYYASYTWGGAANFARHWGHNDKGVGNQRAYMTVIYENAEQAFLDWNYIKTTFMVGDVLQLANSNGVYHTMIIHDTTNMSYAQHTNNGKNAPLYDLLQLKINKGSNEKLIFHKIKN